jgi:phosphoglycerate kinase
MIEAATAGCAIVLPVDGVVAREFKAGADNEVVAIEAIPDDAMMLDVGPKSIAAVNAWVEQGRNAGLERPARRLRDRPSTRPPSPLPSMPPSRTKAGKLSRSPAAAIRFRR